MSTNVPTTDVPPPRTRLPWWRAMLFGLQHVIVMYTGCVAVPLVFGAAMGLDQRTIGTWLLDPPDHAPLPRGLGENTVAALPAAIANAVAAATGAQVHAFPLAPPLVLDAIDAVGLLAQSP